MRYIVFALALTGCVDYSKLSAGESDLADALVIHEPALDFGSPTDDLASAPAIDLGGTDLAGDLAQVAITDLATAGDAALALPASCSDLNTLASNDGNYTLYYNRSRPWVAYCKGMGSASITPVEYLTLPQGAAGNYSIIGADLGAYSQYTKVRIDPVTLKIDTSDGTYNVAPKNQSYGCTPPPSGVVSVPFAYAYAYCGMMDGTGMVDLRGTPFAVTQGSFTLLYGATATYSNNDQTVSLLAPHGANKATIYATQLQLAMP